MARPTGGLLASGLLVAGRDVTGGLLLAAYAVAAGFGAPAAMRRGWAWREPRIAIALRLAVAVSWLIAVPLATVSLAAPAAMTWSTGSAWFAGPVPAAGLALAASFAGWACWHLFRGLVMARRGQRAVASYVAGAGRADPVTGAVIIDDGAPNAYCLPAGRRQLIVVSAGALDRLTQPQLRAVLAHERAHLRGRHHVMLAAAEALGRAFPAVPLLAGAAADLAVLAEMSADDAAIRRHDRVDLAAALVALAGAGVGAAGAGAGAGAASAALAAGGHAAVARVKRLLAPPPPSGVAARSVRMMAIAVPAMVSLLPVVLAACGLITRS